MAAIAPPPIRSRGIIGRLKHSIPVQDGSPDLNRHLLSANSLAAGMRAAEDVEQLQRFLGASIQEWMPDITAALCIVDGERYRKVPLSGFGKDGEKILPISVGLAGRVLKTNTPLRIQDAVSDGKAYEMGMGATESFARSVMIFPLSAFGRVAGCLELASYQPNRFDEVEYNLGSLLTAQLSSSLENILTRQELAAANARLRDHDQLLIDLNSKLLQLAHTDDATGLYNKRRLFEQLDAEIARAKRYGEILSCLMLDLDHFKLVNDTYGHQAGDEVLRQFGTLLKRRLRVTDFVARYGGEEFTILLPRTDGAGARRVAENLLAAIKTNEFVAVGRCIPLTVSIGIACCTKFDQLDSQRIIMLADNALYQAKAAGRDTVCLAEESEVSQRSSQEFVKEVKPA
jgi:diguanylate cyclase (GGDEF)-like protein